MIRNVNARVFGTAYYIVLIVEYCVAVVQSKGARLVFQCQWRRLQSAEALYGAPTPIPTDWVTREGSSCGVTVAPSTCVYRQASTVGRLRRADGTRVRHIRYLRNLDGYYLGRGTQPVVFQVARTIAHHSLTYI